MCGRFVSTTPPDQLAACFGAEQLGERLLEPSYNVAPTNSIWTVFEDDGKRLLDTAHWGLIPFWAKEAKIGNKMINARAETVATKNAFRKPFQRQRCIIPVDSFYEWVKLEGQEKKTPMRIHRLDDAPFAFAGLWETWRDPEGDPEERIRSCTIITGTPNDKIATIHNRMPIMLPPSAWDTWLDREMRDPEVLEQFLVPAPAELMEFHPVSTAVNNPRTKGAELIEPVEIDAPLPGQDA